MSGQQCENYEDGGEVVVSPVMGERSYMCTTNKCGCICIDNIFDEVMVPNAELRELIQHLKDEHKCNEECARFDDCALYGSLDDLLYDKELGDDFKDDIREFLSVFVDELEEIQLM